MLEYITKQQIGFVKGLKTEIRFGQQKIFIFALSFPVNYFITPQVYFMTNN